MLRCFARHGEYVAVMASDGAARPAGRAIENLSRLLDRYFCDPSTGKVVLYEKPNRIIKAVGALMGTARMLRGAHMVEPGDPFDVFAERAAMAMFLWWSVDQMRHGTTKYRKTIGAVTLIGALSRTVQAELARATSGISLPSGSTPATSSGASKLVVETD